MSLLLGGGAYARDKNTSVRVCAKNTGGGRLMCMGDVFAGQYGNSIWKLQKNPDTL